MNKVRYSWKQCIANYRFHSIFLKNFLLLLLLILIPFTCMLGISVYSYVNIRQGEEKIYRDDMSVRISKDIENIFFEIRNKAIMLGTDPQAETFFCADNLETEYFYDTKYLLDSLALYKRSTDVIDSIYVYASHSNVVISGAGRFLCPDFDDKECIDAWDHDGDMFQVKYLDRKIAGKRKETISFYYRPDYGGDRKGVVVINISLDKLKSAIVPVDGASIYLLKDDQIFYDGNMEKNGVQIENVEEFCRDTKEVITSLIEIGVCNMSVAVKMSRRTLDYKLHSILTYIIACEAIVLVISIAFVFYISRKMFDPYSEIMHALEQNIEVGNQKILHNHNEMGYIMNSIYRTLERNRNVEEELASRILALKKAQAVALQSQINPHFINNTLDSINWMAVKQLGDKNDISKMLRSLSYLMMAMLQNPDIMVSLSEEIAYVKKYLFIQQMRFEDGFDVEYENLDQFQDRKVIKMILQPVVENAFEYGIKPYVKRGRIVISVETHEDTLRIYVHDSGIGMPQSKVEEINNAIQENVIKETEHIGLSNVNQRIKLAFGDAYGVKLESRIGYGTKVILDLPDVQEC